MNSIVEAGMVLCNYRLMIGGILGILIGLLLCIFGGMLTFSDKFDTDKYIETIANVFSKSAFSEKDNEFKIKVYYKYIVDNTEYDAQEVLTDKFSTNEQANTRITAISSMSSKKVFYNKDSPSMYVFEKNQEEISGSMLMGIATIIIVCGAIGIAMRGNKIFCGMTIANDVKNTLFSNDK
jgi:hypothetical protein